MLFQKIEALCIGSRIETNAGAFIVLAANNDSLYAEYFYLFFVVFFLFNFKENFKKKRRHQTHKEQNWHFGDK